MKRLRLSGAILLALSGGTIMGADERDAGTEPRETAHALERVEVIGSRIRRAEIETSQPVFVIEREQIERFGFASVGDLLQDVTTQGAALNTTFNNGGDGRVLVDLRDLGANRTLVLLNGRRLSTSLDGTVDLTAIPLAIVERIEVLKDGASAIYGSDAMAGVVNIQTRDDYAGAETRAYFGENEAGDGAVETYDFTVGTTRDRASAAMNASYAKQESIFAGDRELSAVPVFGLPPNATEAGASPTTPFGRFGFGPRGTCALAASAVYPAGGCANLARFPAAEATTYDPVTRGYRTFDRATDGYNFAPENYLQTPYERAAVFAQGRYEVLPTLAVTLEALYNERRSELQLAPQPFEIGITVSPPLRHVVPANHVYNPFGQPVTRLSFRPGGQFRNVNHDADTFRIDLGLDGGAEWAGRSIFWNVHALHAEQTIHVQRRGELNGDRLLQSLGPTFRDGGGVPRCGSPEAPIAGCVPVDPFRGPEGLTPEMLDYLYFTAQSTQHSALEDYTANITGDVVVLPAGPLGVALGAEHRRERASVVPDAQLRRVALGQSTTGAFQPVAGSTEVDELYAELAVPLLADRWLARTLELSLAARRSDYATFGATTNAKLGVRWSPVDSLLVRGNWSEGFRAPNLSELFTPTSGFQGRIDQFDPCVAAAIPPPAVRANCIADGVPGGTYVPSGFLFEGIFGGNPDLRPETAVDRTLGVVWSPGAVPALDLSLDWYRIEIESAVSNIFPSELLRACALTGVSEACERTERDPATGELLRLDARTINSGLFAVEGYDLTLHYARDTRWGRFALVWDTAYYAESLQELPRGGPVFSLAGNYFGRDLSLWRMRSNLDLAWQRGDFGASLGIRYYDGLDEGCYGNRAALADEDVCSDPAIVSPTFYSLQGENHIPSRTYVNLGVDWEAPWNAVVRVGVSNAFDRDPPFSLSTFANSFDPAYPVPGRFWYASYTQVF